MGSLNGTYVNRERIEEAELFGGDEVQIGKFRLVFLTHPALAGPNAAAEAPRTTHERPARARASLNIGEVLAQLRPEFPDISPSKIRFLEAEGLIEPARPSPATASSPLADVERLQLHPDHAAGRVPAAAGDQGAPGRPGR